MFLVLLRCNFHDVPIRLCSSEADAKRVADALTKVEADETFSMFGIDRTGEISIDIVEFSMEDGCPIANSTARMLDGNDGFALK